MSKSLTIALTTWVLLTASLIARVAQAQSECSSPRSATDSVFRWQQPGSQNIARAIQCLDRRGRSTVDLERAAVRIKRVYDSRALWIEPDTLSDDPEWRDPDTGQAVVAPHPGLPLVVVARGADGQWRWTRESLDRIGALYEESNSYVDRLVQYLPEWLKMPKLIQLPGFSLK